MTRTLRTLLRGAALGIALVASAALAQSVQWSTYAYGAVPLAGMPGDSNFFYNFPTIVARDAANNVFVVGHSTNTATKVWVVTKHSGSTGAVLWSKTFDTGKDTFATAVAVDASGNAVVTGYGTNVSNDTDIITRKYQGSDGALLWSATFDGGRYDYGRSIAIDASGNVLVGGDSESLSPVMPGWKVLKYAGATGTLLWENQYRSGNGDYLRKIMLSSTGDVVAAGSTCATSSGCSDFRVQKFSGSTGAAIWGRTVGDAVASDSVSDIAIDGTGNVFVAGYSTTSGGSWRIVKIDTSAEPVTTVAWNVIRHYGDTGVDVPYSIRIAPDGHPVVAGRAYNGSTQWAVRTIKFDAATGADLWVDTYTGPDFYYEEPHALEIDAAGDVYIGGWTATAGNTPAFARKLAGASGTPLWTQVELGNGTFYGCVFDGAGNLVMSGRKGLGPYEFYTVKYSSSGARLWEAAAPTGVGPAGAGDGTAERSRQAIAVDAAGNSFVAGYIDNADLTRDWIVAKLGPDGAIAWTVAYGAPGKDDRATAVALDPVTGHPVVAGFTTNATPNHDLRVIKFDAANGSVIWNVAHDSGGGDEAAAIAIDAVGDVVVTGKVSGASDADALTRKLSGATGATLWSATFNGGGNDSPVGIVLDAAGNPAVAMQSDGPIDRDFRVVKYSGATGTQLWGASFDFGGTDSVNAIAIDAAGNLALAGTSQAATPDMRVVKVNGATGASIWSTTINGGGNDEGYDVVFGASGDVFVTGKSFTAANGSDDVRVARLAGATGATVWSTAWHRGIVNGVSSTDAGYAIRVNAAGNAAIVGRSGSLSGNADLQYLEFSGADGALVFALPFAGAGGSDDVGVAFAFAGGSTLRIAGRGSEFPGVSGLLVASLSIPAATTTIVTDAPDPSLEGVPYAVNVTVSSVGGTPSGSVSVSDGVGGNCSIPSLDASGSGTCNLNSPSIGNGLLTLTATFTPANGQFAPSSGTTPHTVILGTTLTVAKTGTGSGQVTSNPAGIDCGADCVEIYAIGATVTLTPVADPGSAFAGWTGSCSGIGSCVLSMSANRTVTANFTRVSYTLTVTKGGSGSGTVTSVPAGINCGATCGASFDSGTIVTLTASPASGSQFSGWTGCPAVSGNQCTVTLSSAASVTANFALASGNPARSDFNGDGKPDIIWSNTTSGATYIWRMNGTSLLSDSFYATIDPSWKIQGVADFNGDGHPDIVWRNTANGACYVWYTVNGVFTGTDAFLFSLPPEWVIQGVADFNQDGKPDFLMRNVNSGNAFAWFFNDNVPVGDQFLFNIDPSWKVEAVGDLNSDGQPDLLFRSMSSGLSFAWNTSYTGGVLSLGTSSPMIYSIDPVWEVVQLADWNGDGKPDLLFRNAATGLVFVWYLDGVTLGASDFIYQIDPSWEIVPRR